MIDIVIVTYNRHKLLLEMLKALDKQTFKQFNVIICDDGSKTLINVNHFSFIKKYIWNFDDGYHRVARFNEGISHCKSNKVILLDDDTIPQHDDWLLSHYNNLEEFDISRGMVKFLDGSYNNGGWFSTTNTGFKLNKLIEIGCMDQNYDGCYGGEDVDLGKTVKKHGLTLSPFDNKTECLHKGIEYKDGDRSDAVVGRNRKYFFNKWGHDWLDVGKM